MASSARARTALVTLEAAYTLAGQTEDWLERVMAAAASELDLGLGLLGWTFRVDGAGRHSPTSSMLARGDVATELHSRLLAGSGEASRRLALLERSLGRGGPALTSAAAAVERFGDEPEQVSAYLGDLRTWGVADVLGAYVKDASGRGVVLAAPAPARQVVDGGRAARWARVLTHLANAHRLHQALLGKEEGAGLDAVLDPMGAVRHAEPRAHEHLEALREAARRIDHARAPKADPAQALEAWKGLVAGRWTLLDRFDSDGRRYLVARRNEPVGARARGLTRRERQVATYVALGYSSKHVAYALGLAPSTVSSHLRAAMRKLGARDRRDLAALFLSS